MKPTETLEQLLERFTKRMEQIKGKKISTTVEAEKLDNQLHYLRGCKETVEYLMTGKLPDDGNHVGMKDHKPAIDYNAMETKLMKPPVRHGNLDALD